MSKNKTSTEQSILEAAEKEFLSQGFARTKTTEIARLAGVNHAMIHYYFRTKENLFNMVFQKKMMILADSFFNIFEKPQPLFEKVRYVVELHFDFLVANPMLPFFIYSEIINSKEKRSLLVRSLFPKARVTLAKLQPDLDAEAAKGTIRPMDALDLIVNIISLNVFSFFCLPLFEECEANGMKSIETKGFLEHRKKSNVEFILSGLKK